MRASTKVLLFIFPLLLLASLGAYLCSNELNSIEQTTGAQDALYLDSPQAIARLSLGYTGVFAQIYWIRAVQYFGSKHQTARPEYSSLYPLLNIATSLDPQLDVAYELGSTFLAQKPPEGAGQPDLAVAFVEKGIRENPSKWRFYYQLGYIHYLERKDYASAQQAFERGSNVKGAQPWMKVMAAVMAHRGGNLEASRYLWTNIYQSTQDPTVRSTAAKRLMALRVDEAILHLQAIVEEYKRRSAHNPASFQDLIAAGMLRGIPFDPTNKPFLLTPEGKIELQDPGAIPFATEGLEMQNQDKREQDAQSQQQHVSQ